MFAGKVRGPAGNVLPASKGKEECCLGFPQHHKLIFDRCSNAYWLSPVPVALPIPCARDALAIHKAGILPDAS